MVDLVIYDLDGTLVEFKLDFRSMKMRLVKFLKAKTIPSNILDPNSKTSVMLKQLREYLIQERWQEKARIALFKDIFSIIEEYEWIAAQVTNVIPGVEDTLRIIGDIKIIQAVWTNCPKVIADFTLKKFKLLSYFHTVQGRDELTAMKPDPDGLKVLLDKLFVPPQKALMVGDSSIDIIPAVELGVTAIGITSGPASREELVAAGAFKVINSIEELPSLIQQLD